jgi:hypothetical protein
MAWCDSIPTVCQPGCSGRMSTGCLVRLLGRGSRALPSAREVTFWEALGNLCLDFHRHMTQSPQRPDQHAGAVEEDREGRAGRFRRRHRRPGGRWPGVQHKSRVALTDWERGGSRLGSFSKWGLALARTGGNPHALEDLGRCLSPF